MTQPAQSLSSAATAAAVLVAVVAGLAFLHWARAILVPVSLAMVLGLAVAPFVRMLRAAGLGHAGAVFAAVLFIAAVVAWMAGAIGSHAAEIAQRLPAYRETFAANVGEFRRVALSPIEKTWDAADQLLEPRGPAAAEASASAPGGDASPPGRMAIELRAPASTPIERMQRLLSWAWAPIGSMALVVIVLVFGLLEREALRDRFIRLAGGSDLRAATAAINDAGERLSRYLARLFAVNIGVGVALWAALSAIGLPYAALIAVVTATLRFLPFLGVPIAAALALLLALGVAPGWALALWALAVFAAVELVVSHAVEPRVYGQATGLSPLAIVLAATFWGWLWGPVGVLLATPLTLCLAVAGHHVPSLAFLGILLGDGPALTLAQKFYQRALSGDPAEIIAGAHGFLRRHTFAEYCDAVLVPALQLGRIDRERGRITARQYADLRAAITAVLEGLDGAEHGLLPAARGATPLEAILAGALSWRRPPRDGRPPAAIHERAEDPPPTGRAIVLCVGTGLTADELAVDLLVRILRALGADARHIEGEDDLAALAFYGLSRADVRAVCMVSMTAPDAPEQGLRLAMKVRAVLPHANSFGLLLPGLLEHPDRLAVRQHLDGVTTSFVEAARAVRLCLRGRLQPASAASLAERR